MSNLWVESRPRFRGQITLCSWTAEPTKHLMDECDEAIREIGRSGGFLTPKMTD